MSDNGSGSGSSGQHSRPKGPLGIDPLHFSAAAFGLLLLFVLYLLLPRAMRKQYFGAYPKRHAWSARTRARRSNSNNINTTGGSVANVTAPNGTRSYAQSSVEGSYTGGSSLATGSLMTNPSHHRQLGGVGLGAGAGASASMSSRPPSTASMGVGGQRRVGGYGIADQEHQVDFHSQQQQQQLLDLQQNDEIVISAAMQQLREPGVLIVAHGSRGKPKTVRLQLTESSITWRTETRKKSKTGDNSTTGGSTTSSLKPKMGKLHQVPLSHIMYVDVGKQTTALRRVENASVSEALCFSLLTKEGSLDLEANSPRERDALVSCFSLVLDEVHAQNWRDIYRGPSSDMPSSFDELDPPPANNNNMGGGGNNDYGDAHRK